MGNNFRCDFRLLFISLALRKFKKESNVFTVILVQGFCPLKTENARFAIGFRLNNSLQN